VFTDPIRVAGVQGANYNERAFTIQTSGTWAGTVNVQRSIEGPDRGFGNYPRDASAATTEDITGNATYSNQDYDDNLVAWYRVGFKDGNYTSGVLTVTFTYAYGGLFGVGRVVDVNSGTSIDVAVQRPFGGLTYVSGWSESAWSSVQSFPNVNVLHDGRLWFFSGARIFGSVADNYESFDQDLPGDAGPIIRTIGKGPVDAVNWALSLERLVFGTSGGEFVLKSSAIDTPITPTDASNKRASSLGSKQYFPAKEIDDAGIFVHKSGKRLYQIAPAQTPNLSGYETTELTLLHQEILKQGVVSMAVQRNPDTRIHLVLGDGNAAILTYDRAEKLASWVRVQTGTTGAPGAIERVAVLPGTDEDLVYYIVKRTIGGATKRYLEKWAEEDDADGDDLSRILDSFIVYDSTSTTTISGLDHLEGEAVHVWADGNVVEEVSGDGFAPKAHTVASGAITLATAASSVVAGLQYTAQWKSTKLAYAAAQGSALTKKKRVINLGLILGKSHHRGLQYGGDFTTMYSLPQTLGGADVASGTIHADWDEEAIPFPGPWDTDARLCLQCVAPYNAMVKTVVLGIQTNA
jgi:hypothetical protein